MEEEIEKRIVLIGDPAVGKSTLFERIKSGAFLVERNSSIAPDTQEFHTKHNQKNYKLVFFDLPGQTTRISTNVHFLRDKGMALILFDPTDNNITIMKKENIPVESKSIESIDAWKKILYSVADEDTPIGLVATHKDEYGENPPFDEEKLA